MKARGILLVVSFLASSLLAEKRGLQPSDFYKEIGVSQVEVSPRGDLIAFTVTTIDQDANKRHREVWIQRLRDGKSDGEPVRFSDPTQESSSPSWAPDGSLLSFRSRRGKDKNSIWFLRVDPPGGEVFHIEGVNATPVWSPDGKWIAFSRSEEDPEEDGNKKDKREGWIASDAKSSTLDPKRFDGRVITSIRYKRDGTLPFRPDPLIRKKRQLFVVPSSGGDPVRLTTLGFDVGGICWSRDSNTILFTGDPEQDDELKTDLTGEIFAVSRTGGEPRKLTENPGSESSVAWSPSSEMIAFLSTPARGEETDLMVVEVAADGSFRGSPSNLTANWDLRPGPPIWTPDGGAVRFSAGIGGNRHIFEIGSNGGQVRQVTKGDRRLRGLSSDAKGRVLAYTVTDATTPPEVFVSSFDGFGESRVTTFNDGWLKEVTLNPAEPLKWTVANGTEIEGWVVKPVDYDPDKKYPLILKIHGGPHGAYGNTFFRTFHVLSATGFFVLYPNPRGSSGYGHDFMYATRGKWGLMDSEDYLGGVDAALARYSAIDSTRIGVSGGSYGGYMTNWLTSTTTRFSAAVTSRSITNWESWYGTSDAQRLTEYEFLGAPWEQRELYRKLSPISYVENVTAPTLIIHSEQDWRTPIGDGEQWFMALKKRGVPVELVRYPRSSHGLSRTGEPWLLVDRLERIRSWFDHWLNEAEGEPTPTASEPSKD